MMLPLEVEMDGNKGDDIDWVCDSTGDCDEVANGEDVI